MIFAPLKKVLDTSVMVTKDWSHFLTLVLVNSTLLSKLIVCNFTVGVSSELAHLHACCE